jgi:hypothetical protein
MGEKMALFKKKKKEEKKPEPTPVPKAEMTTPDLPPVEESGDLFPNMRGQAKVAAKMETVTNMTGQFKIEHKEISEEADKIILGVDDHLARLMEMRSQIEKEAREIDALWNMINFEVEYLQQVVGYATKTRAKRSELPEMIKNDQVDETVQAPAETPAKQ